MIDISESVLGIPGGALDGPDGVLGIPDGLLGVSNVPDRPYFTQCTRHANRQTNTQI